MLRRPAFADLRCILLPGDDQVGGGGVAAALQHVLPLPKKYGQPGHNARNGDKWDRRLSAPRATSPDTPCAAFLDIRI